MPWCVDQLERGRTAASESRRGCRSDSRGPRRGRATTGSDEQVRHRAAGDAGASERPPPRPPGGLGGGLPVLLGRSTAQERLGLVEGVLRCSRSPTCAACFTDSWPVRIWAEHRRGGCCRSRRRPSASPAARTSSRAAARSLTLEPSRLVAFGMLPFACERLLARGAREVGDPGTPPATSAALRRHREVGAAEEARHRLARRVARHHELPGDLLVLLAGAAAEPGRPEDRRRPALREHGVRSRVRLVELSRSTSAASALKNFLYAVRPGDRLLRSRACRPTCRASTWRSIRRSRRRSSERVYQSVAADVERREALHVLLHRADLGELGLELREALRQLLDARLLEQIGAVGDRRASRRSTARRRACRCTSRTPSARRASSASCRTGP